MSFRTLLLFAAVCSLSACDQVGAFIASLDDDLEDSQVAETSPIDPALDPSVDPAAVAPTGETVDEGAHAEAEPSGPTPLQVWDKGLKLVRTTVLLPPGWRAYQDIATNPRTGLAERYVLDYYGPNGELIRATGITNYYGPLGQRFSPMWRKRIRTAMKGVATDVEIGKRRPTQMLERLPLINKVLGNARREAFEVPLTGTRDGEPLQGVAYVLHVPATPDMGTFLVNIVAASPEHYEGAVDAGWAIGKSEQINPEFTRRQQQISKRVMARSARDHQARMRARQAQFQAHQARMKQQSAVFDRANKAWLDNFRGSGGSGGGSGYDSHDQFIDSIHETDSFHDPSTGQRVQRQGGFKYNFTDGQGNFYGTNDASFDPAALQGDWQATEPLRPQ